MAAPPTARGELRTELARLAAKTWCHPVSGEAVRFGVSTIERWYYRASGEKKDVMVALSRKRRSDADKTLVAGKLRQRLDAQYKSHPGWSANLHADNLAAASRLDKELGRCPSYQTVRRYLRATGKSKLKKPRRASEAAARAQVEAREVRSLRAASLAI